MWPEFLSKHPKINDLGKKGRQKNGGRKVAFLSINQTRNVKKLAGHLMKYLLFNSKPFNIHEGKKNPGWGDFEWKNLEAVCFELAPGW